MTDTLINIDARTETAPNRAALVFDPQEFCHYLADSDWSEEQKIEFIEALWQIVLSFVDLGFDLHPMQRVIDAPSTLELDSGDVLDSTHINQILETREAGPSELRGTARRES